MVLRVGGVGEKTELKGVTHYSDPLPRFNTPFVDSGPLSLFGSFTLPLQGREVRSTPGAKASRDPVLFWSLTRLVGAEWVDEGRPRQSSSPPTGVQGTLPRGGPGRGPESWVPVEGIKGS